MQAATNEVVAASVMCLPAARLDRPMAAGRSAALRHFSVVRKLDGLPFPAGSPGRSHRHCALLGRRFMLVMHRLLSWVRVVPRKSCGMASTLRLMSACSTPLQATISHSACRQPIAFASAGFMDKVKDANRSALGVRNGGAMLSAQVLP